jgi:hypothetical protein
MHIPHPDAEWNDSERNPSIKSFNVSSSSETLLTYLSPSVPIRSAHSEYFKTFICFLTKEEALEGARALFE